MIRALPFAASLLVRVDSYISLPPNVKRVMLNVGSFTTPVLPEGDDTIAIAFEPIVGCEIKSHPNLYVVHTAVSANSSLATMQVYNRGISSSLSTANPGWWSTGKRHSGMKIVPTLSLATVIDSIPEHVLIWHAIPLPQTLQPRVSITLGTSRLTCKATTWPPSSPPAAPSTA